MIADAHTDLLLELAHREHRLGETGVFARTWLPLLEAGGVGLQVCPIFVDLELQPEGTLRESLRQVTAFQHALRESPERLLAIRRRREYDAAGDHSDADCVDHLRDELHRLSEVHPDRLVREALSHLALVCGKCGQNLTLLPLGHLKDVKRAPKFSRDFVELGGRDLQFTMGLFQAKRSTAWLRR